MLNSIEHIAKAIKRARQMKGLSQQALGAKIGVPQSHISKVEKGAVDLQTSSLIQLALSLDLELMLVPRQLVPMVNGLQRDLTRKMDGEVSDQIPLYNLDDQDENHG
jgi:HTH-type transcriptional regulator / antitoxin HipB